MRNLEINWPVPRCWKTLVEMEFPEDLDGVSSEKELKGVADPEPHYDDSRELKAVADEFDLILSLSSGQSNYFGGLIIQINPKRSAAIGKPNAGDIIYESEPMATFDDDMVVLVVEGSEPIRFEIHFNWVDNARWAEIEAAKD